MDFPLLTFSSSAKLSSLISLRRSPSSSPTFHLKKITAGQLLPVFIILRFCLQLSISSPYLAARILSPMGISTGSMPCKSRLIVDTDASCFNNRREFVEADPGQDEPSISHAEPKKNPSFSNVMWRSTRPYVLLGSTAGYISVAARTCMAYPHLLGWSQLLKALVGLVALLFAICYLCGINQIFDIEIDRINKPDLPIPSGDLSVQSARLLVASFLAIGVTIAGILNCATFTSSVLGICFLATIYSVPPFNLKRSTLGAIIVNSLGGGCVSVLANSSAARASLGLPFALSLPVSFLLIYTTLHWLVFGILKDFSDIEEDRKHNIPTVAATIGVRNAAFVANGILLIDYIGAILAAIFMPQIFRRSVMIPIHAMFALCLIFKAWKLDSANYGKEESSEFFQFTWKLVFAEFAIFPFI